MNEESGGLGETNPDRRVFAGIAESIWVSVAHLSSDIERQKLGGGR
jgi:hypothetical protein